MNNTDFVNAIKAQMFDQIVKAAKGVKDDPTALLQLIQNNDQSIAFMEKSLVDCTVNGAQ